MHHLLMHAPTATVDLMGPERKVLILEHAPYADDLHTLGGIRVDEKIIGHRTFPPDCSHLPLRPRQSRVSAAYWARVRSLNSGVPPLDKTFRTSTCLEVWRHHRPLAFP